MALDELCQVTVEGIAAGGAALARFQGKSIFVEGTAPGETVICRIVEEHSSWSRAEKTEILAESPDRAEPLCALYGICGGCNLQHLRYEAQLAAKTAILKTSFLRIGGFSPPEPVVIPCNQDAEPWGYRNRMQLHRLHSGDGFGFKGRHSGDVVPVSCCPVADPGIQELLRKSAQGESPLRPAGDRFTVYARKALFLSEGGVRQGRNRLLDRDILMDAAVFFQSNGGMLERLLIDLQKTAATAERNLPMADLYCGVGTFAAFLGNLFPAADLVEANGEALVLAKENVTGVQARFFPLKDSEWVKGRAGPYGFVVVDPPRQGLSPSLAHWLAAQGPALLAYVSCDPATLARDSKILLQGGYALEDLRFYDFYPQTAHIESLAVFKRRN